MPGAILNAEAGARSMDPDDFTFIDLFAGIGGIRLGVKAVGGKCVFSSEWDEHAQATYKANFGETPLGDVTKISSSDIPGHDMLTAGFPCQPFSIIGDGKGFADTRGTLFFEIERILRDKRPHSFLLENVRRLTSHGKGRTLAVILDRLEELGYYTHWRVLNALDFGLPQKRERVYIAGFQKNYVFQFPSKPVRDLRVSLADILEPDEEVDPKYIASKYIRRKRKEAADGKHIPLPSVWHENKSGNVSPLPFSPALRAGASFSYALVNGTRRLTPREQLRLQGFPETFEIFGPESQIRKQTGNSVSVPVVEAVAKKMIEAVRSNVIDDPKPSRERRYRQAALL